MDLFKMTKYQSISDRIKRLASTSNQPTPSPPTQISNRLRVYQSPPSVGVKKYVPDQVLKAKIVQKLSPSRTTTQESQKNQQQQSSTFIHDLLSMRENQPLRMPKRQIRQAFTEQVDERSFSDEIQKEKIANSWKKELEIEKEGKKAAQLGKVKSQSIMKIDQILQSYNSYKLNKQKFMAEIQQNNPKDHQRIISQNLKEYFQQKEQSKIEKNSKQQRQPYMLSQIDNLWNGVHNNDFTTLNREDQNTSEPQFQRSRRPKIDNLSEFTECRISEIKDSIQQGKKLIKHSNSKAKLCNITIQKEQIEPCPSISTMLSPRGLRIPGKICKNTDKSMAIISKRV